MPLETNRPIRDVPNGRDSADRSVIGKTFGSIQIVGDDQLLIRALDRLLRQAGYAVGTEERATGGASPGSVDLAERTVALTIVDLPDDYVLVATGTNDPASSSSPGARFLWLGTTLLTPPLAWFLTKPFTTEEFLSRVEFLLASRN